MTAFDDSTKFKTALESTPQHLSKVLIDEALGIHKSKDVAATEMQLASEFRQDSKSYVFMHLALEEAIKGDQAKNDPKFAASLYRDLAVMDQAAAAAMDKDPLTAAVMLGEKTEEGMRDPYNAKNAIARAERLDPANKDLPQLHLIQNDLACNNTNL